METGAPPKKSRGLWPSDPEQGSRWEEEAIRYDYIFRMGEGGNAFPDPGWLADRELAFHGAMDAGDLRKAVARAAELAKAYEKSELFPEAIDWQSILVEIDRADNGIVVQPTPYDRYLYLLTEHATRGDGSPRRVIEEIEMLEETNPRGAAEWRAKAFPRLAYSLEDSEPEVAKILYAAAKEAVMERGRLVRRERRQNKKEARKERRRGRKPARQA